MAAPSATDRTAFRGVTVNRATRAALLWAEEQLPAKDPAIQLAQGSYNVGVAASAGTHDKGGVVDVRTRHLTPVQRTRLLRALRDAGFAAWVRDERDGMPPHIHACIFGDGGQDMAAGARGQRLSYDAGRDGLRSNRADRNPYRPSPRVKWSWAKNRPVKR